MSGILNPCGIFLCSFSVLWQRIIFPAYPTLLSVGDFFLNLVSFFLEEMVEGNSTHFFFLLLFIIYFL
ncbi:hypothetical protein IMY05_004G0145500 [Salix suchowensis]|nr:hypothetical protein IMY05_004G0145500 [Salix suchowensis]